MRMVFIEVITLLLIFSGCEGRPRHIDGVGATVIEGQMRGKKIDDFLITTDQL